MGNEIRWTITIKQIIIMRLFFSAIITIAVFFLITAAKPFVKSNGSSYPILVNEFNKETKRNVDSSYLKNIIEELRKKWPTNRNVNLVFHGHSVPSGYYRAGVVNIFQSYPMQALKKITEKYNYATVNCIKTSIGGENAEQGAKRFKKTVLVHNADVLFIDYALNDRKMGLERSKIAWESMIKKALSKNLKVVLLTPTPDLNENIKSDDAPLEKFSQQIIDLAKKYNVELIDSYHIFKQLAMDGIDLNMYMSQNNHPNEKGHQLVADEICKLFAIQ